MNTWAENHLMAVPIFYFPDEVFFYFAAVFAAGTAVYHILFIFSHSGNSPVWRHIIFCCISIAGVWALLKRPPWLIYPMIVLTLQQWYSHGNYLMMKYHEEHSIHWISVAVIVLLPVITFALWIDRKRRS
ncbi:MAG: hypothetical protein ABI581_14310, partial [Sediminibacterium sp.]